MSDIRINNTRRILSSLNYSGIDRIYQQIGGELGMILTLHHVKREVVPKFAPNAHLSVHPDFIESMIKLLRKRDIDIISMDEVRRRIMRPDKLRRFVVFTFDDGYRDNIQNALPILKKYDVPYTIFIAPGLIEGTSDIWWEAIEALVRKQDRILLQKSGIPTELDCTTPAHKQASFDYLINYLTTEVPEIELRQRVREICWLYKIDIDAVQKDQIMSWEDISHLSADPLCTIGAHTINHYALARLDEKAARNEMAESAAVLEAATGTRPTHIAYPFGYPEAAGRREFEIAQKLKFKTGLTTRPGHIYRPHRDHMTALPRVSVNGFFQRMRYFSPLTSGLPTRMRQKGRRLDVK